MMNTYELGTKAVMLLRAKSQAYDEGVNYEE